MAATSVTGKGLGAAKTQKGPGNGRDYFVPQVNPHVVAAGTGATSGVGHTLVVTFPVPLAGAPAGYVVLPVAEDAVAGDMHVTKAGTTTFTGFTLTSAANGNVGWAVVKAGLGLDVARAD